MRRLVAFAALAAAFSLAHPAGADNDNRKYGDYIKASRMLAEWRYDEARTLIDEIAERTPDAAETRYLQAELAYMDGKYLETATLLEGLDDDAVSGNIGYLRGLASSTLGVTVSFAHKDSSGGHFRIYYPPGKDEVIVDLAGDVLEAAYTALGADFGYYPDNPVRVELLTKPADLASLSTLTAKEIETTGTIALCKYNKLMVVSPRATLFGYPWMDTLVHEYVHYVVSSLSHDSVPVWLHEGLARFEQTRWREEPNGELSPMDEHLLASALANQRLISFDDMHPSMAKLPSQQAAALAFAEVYTMVDYIHETAGYEGIREVIRLQREGKSARRAVGEVLDMRWKKVETGWKSFLNKRNLRTSKSISSRASSPRIRFDKGGEKDDNVGVDEVESKKARKFARLGGILRSRGMPEAAALEYEKALAIVGPDDPFVASKLSRTYLDLQDYEKAIELAEPLSKLDEHDSAPLITLGIAYLATGDSEASRSAFERALRVNPFDPAVRCGLQEVYADLGETALAGREETACARLR